MEPICPVCGGLRSKLAPRTRPTVQDLTALDMAQRDCSVSDSMVLSNRGMRHYQEYVKLEERGTKWTPEINLNPGLKFVTFAESTHLLSSDCPKPKPRHESVDHASFSLASHLQRGYDLTGRHRRRPTLISSFHHTGIRKAGPEFEASYSFLRQQSWNPDFFSLHSSEGKF